MSLTLDGTTGISATGNIYGNNVIVTNTLTAGTFSPTNLSASGNIDAGNLRTTGIVSATGNITGNYILGNGSQLTGVDATQIVSGTSNAKVVSSGGNIAVGIGGTSNVAVFATTGAFITGVVSASANITGGNLLTAGLISATSTITSAANVVGGNMTTAGLISATGNVIGGNLRTAGLISATGAITTAGDLTITGNIVDTAALGINTTANANITLNAGTGFIIASSGILNGQANGTGNIGNSTGYFNTIFAKATSAQYADLAEMYSAGSQYEPGTVVIFDGSYEVEISTTSHANNVAGVISTNPSYIMNAGQSGPHVVAVALQGRVPTRVIGAVKKGDRMVSSDLPGVATVLDPACYEPGCIIGKALQAHEPTFDDAGNELVGTIEVVVGRI